MTRVDMLPPENEGAAVSTQDLALIVHDLKHPLAVIALELDVLRDVVGKFPTAHRSLARIEQNAASIERTVNDLLDLSSLEADRFTLELERLDLAVLLPDILDRAVSTRDRWRVHYENGGAAVVNVDPIRIERVVANLVHNALKYAAPSSDIVVRVHAKAHEACVAVLDHGPGLAPDEALHIFEKFRRACSARKHAGSGLGLYICCKIVEAHGGSIGVDSVAGLGSRFYFTLPLTAP